MMDKQYGSDNSKIMKFSDKSLDEHIAEDEKKLKQYLITPPGDIIEAYSMNEAINIARKQWNPSFHPGNSIKRLK